MIQTNKIYAETKSKNDEREMYEMKLWKVTGAEANGDYSNELYDWQEYIQWELSLNKKKHDVDLASAIFERCIMRYDYQANAMWEWYLDYLVSLILSQKCPLLTKYQCGRQKKQVDRPGY